MAFLIESQRDNPPHYINQFLLSVQEQYNYEQMQILQHYVRT